MGPFFIGHKAYLGRRLQIANEIFMTIFHHNCGQAVRFGQLQESLLSRAFNLNIHTALAQK